MVIQRQRCLSGNRLINSHSLLVTESNKTLGRIEGLGTALPALLVKKERVTKPLRKPAWKATSLPDFVQSSLVVIHSYQLCLRSNREQVWLSTVLQSKGVEPSVSDHRRKVPFHRVRSHAEHNNTMLIVWHCRENKSPLQFKKFIYT